MLKSRRHHLQQSNDGSLNMADGENQFKKTKRSKIIRNLIFLKYGMFRILRKKSQSNMCTTMVLPSSKSQAH